MEGIQTELHILRSDAKRQSIAVAKLEESTVRQNEVNEVRERVAAVEPLLRQIEAISTTTRRVEEESARMKGIITHTTLAYYYSYYSCLLLLLLFYHPHTRTLPSPYYYYYY